jgi:hypothetical protein
MSTKVTAEIGLDLTFIVCASLSVGVVSLLYTLVQGWM